MRNLNALRLNLSGNFFNSVLNILNAFFKFHQLPRNIKMNEEKKYIIQLFQWQEKSENPVVCNSGSPEKDTDFETSLNILYESFKTWHRLQVKNIVTTQVKHDVITRDDALEKYPDLFSLLHYGSRDRDSYRIGKGRYSDVYARGKYAFKIIKTIHERNPSSLTTLRCNLKEMCFFHSMDHKNVMKVFVSQCVLEHGNFKKLIHQMPYARKTLGDAILNREILCYSEMFRLFRGIGEGLAYMHQHGIVHGDIKPSNVLIDDNRTLISDFTLTNFENKGTGISFGSLYWRSPETLAEHSSGKCNDIWGFGIMLLDALYGCYYMQDVLQVESNEDMLLKLPYLIGPPPETWLERHPNKLDRSIVFDERFIQRIRKTNTQISLSNAQTSNLHDLISRILQWEPADRATITEILNHPFFAINDQIPSQWPEKKWSIQWRDRQEKESLIKWIKFYYHETFHTALPSNYDWLLTDSMYLAKQLLDQLKSLQCTFNVNQIIRYAGQLYYFFYLDFYPECPLFECAIFHMLQLLEFNIFTLNPEEVFLNEISTEPKPNFGNPMFFISSAGKRVPL